MPKRTERLGLRSGCRNRSSRPHTFQAACYCVLLRKLRRTRQQGKPANKCLKILKGVSVFVYQSKPHAICSHVLPRLFLRIVSGFLLPLPQMPFFFPCLFSFSLLTNTSGVSQPTAFLTAGNVASTLPSQRYSEQLHASRNHATLRK